MKDSNCPLLARGASVPQDWRAWLPEEKAQVFRKQEHHLECFYNMFSVSLNEAIDLRNSGLLPKSLRVIEVASELCELFTRQLTHMLRALYEHAKHYGTIPNAAPLDPANFQGQRGQRSARMSSLLNRVLLSHRLQFLHKVVTLEEMVEDLRSHFCAAAGDLAQGLSIEPEHHWNQVDADHYDLTTCLRETMVLFKSFLVVLPVGQLAVFQDTVREQSQAPHSEVPAPQRVIRHRRMPAFAGE